ncbi:MAG: phosphate ABC transporter permease PstA [Candidatus Acidiferrales bacterium]
MSFRTVWRKGLSAVMMSLTGLCALVTVSVLVLILGYLAWNGATALHWSFFTKLPVPVGETGGGIANAIAGSAKLLLLAAIVGIPIGLLGAVYLAEYASPIPAFLVRYSADLLNGVPSIVIGIFAFTVAVMPFHGFSAYAGGFALGVMMIPIILRSCEDFLRAVPGSLREGAMAVGASKWRTILTVVVPAASGGIMTAILLSLSRVAGETAPLLFTAFGNNFWNHGLNEPIASLPVVIYTYAISPYDDWHRQAWAAGLVLLGLVLVTNVVARGLLARPAGQRR